MSLYVPLVQEGIGFAPDGLAPGVFKTPAILFGLPGFSRTGIQNCRGMSLAAKICRRPLRGRTAYPKPMADTLRDVFLHEGTFSYAAFFSIIKGLPKGKEQSYEHRTHQGHPPRAGPGRGRAILSEAILPPSEDALQYLAGHAAKCFASDEAKACTLADDSAFLPLLWNIEDDFEKKTAVIAGDWFRVMQENPAIPAGDAAFLLLEIDGAEYLAALKLNYKPGWCITAVWTAGRRQ